MHTILLISNDSHLMSTRAAILADEANVVMRSPESFAGSAPDGPFELLILCHSVNDDARHNIIQDVRHRWPQTKVLQLEPMFGLQSPGEADAVTVAMPKQLLRTSKEMLQALDEGLAGNVPCSSFSLRAQKARPSPSARECSPDTPRLRSS